MIIEKTQFNFSRWPSVHQARLTMEELVYLVHDTGPKWRNRRIGTEAAATFMAESGARQGKFRSDPRAYLARVQLPEDEYFLVERIEGKPDVTIFRSAGYVSIKRDHERLPKSLSLLSCRHVMYDLGCEVVSADRGVCQNNQDYHDVPDAEAFSAIESLARGYRTYVDWGDTFNAWFANRDGKHELHLPAAEKAWDKLFP